MQPTRPRPQLQNIEELETQISLEALRQQKEAFGNSQVQTVKGTPLSKKINTHIRELLQNYPRTHNGSVFVNTYLTVTPKLAIKLSSLDALLSEGDLFRDEIGKTIYVEPITHPVFGNITSEPMHLNIKNIHFSSGSILQKNDWSEDRLRRDRIEQNTTVVNKSVTMGFINTDSRLQKAQLVADIEFGELFTAKDQIIEVEIPGEASSTEWIISLPQLKGKILYDGSVTLQNGTTVDVDELLHKRVKWINSLYDRVLIFPLE